MSKEELKLYSKEKLIDIIEKLSVEFAIKNQQYEYIRHNDYSNELQQDYKSRIDKAIEYIKENSNALGVIETIHIRNLLNILRGKDK